MESHPIPKNLMDVEFKLFGTMTLREFGTLAMNLIVALVIYTLKLPAVLSWPLISIFVILGFAFAFVRIHGQPFSVYLTNFIYAMFTPQRKIWKKSPKLSKTLTQSFETPKYVKQMRAENFDIGEIVMRNSKVDAIDDDTSKYEEKIFSNFNRYKSESMSSNFISNVKVERDPLKPMQDYNISNKDSIQETVVKKEDIKNTKPDIEPIKKGIANEAEEEHQTNEITDTVKKDDSVNILETEKDITENRRGSIYGNIVDLNGNPCSNCNIMVKNKKYELLRQTKSNIEGNFRIQTPLDSGTYFVFTEDQKGSKFRPEEVLLENGNDVQLSIVEIK